jgi:hypothetical protein
VNTAHLEWRKSSRSTAEGDCVEVAVQPRAVAVRDSKNASGPTLTIPTAGWSAFRADLRGKQA